MSLSVRELKESDVSMVVDYFINADANYLKGMGAEKDKLPDRSTWISNIISELNKPIKKKANYYILWLLNDEPIGHSNINKLVFGSHANMHLHMWRTDKRRTGYGLDLMKLTIPYYFENFGLKKLICEPYALNPAPYKVLKILGFEFIKAYDITPGVICFHQTVNRYELTRDQFYKPLN